MIYCKTKAIVLDNRTAGVNKNRIVLLTEKYGKIITSISGYGKGVNHWAGVFEGGNILELSCIRRGAFYTVTGWEMLYFAQDKGLKDFASNQLLLEATNEILPLNEPDAKLYRWLRWTLQAKGDLKLYAYLARIIYQGGFLNFSDRGIIRAVENNFEEYLARRTKSELAELLKREIDFIENFIGRPIKSYVFFNKIINQKPAIDTAGCRKE